MTSFRRLPQGGMGIGLAGRRYQLKNRPDEFLKFR